MSRTVREKFSSIFNLNECFFFIVSRRLIDFHLTLLKRISLGKGAQREKFVPIITKVILE
jgi:hypothetical protein